MFYRQQVLLFLPAKKKNYWRVVPFPSTDQNLKSLLVSADASTNPSRELAGLFLSEFPQLKDKNFSLFLSCIHQKKVLTL
ncbi:MAG TPA: hypothetical protein EYQ26_01185 [Rhodospirillales bacterium]|nr:hypothetical protein [Rhodospirillales bacterium]